MKAKILSIGMLCAMQLAACSYELDTTREAPERGSLGQEIYRIIEADLQRMHPKKGLALAREQERLVEALDGLMPDAMLSDLQDYLVAILPLYDEGVLQSVFRPSACILAQFADDAQFLQANWYADHPSGYGKDETGSLMRRLLVNPTTPDLLDHLAVLWLAHDGLDDQFVPDDDEDDTFSALQRELADKMTAAAIDEDPDCAACVFLDFLLSTDGRLMAGQGEEHWIVRTDVRGRARPLSDPGTAEPISPFVDTDQDGLADIDSQRGDFIDQNGAALDVPPPFQPDGSRSLVGGSLLYEYSDLRQSMLGALVDQLEPLIADGFIWELPPALRSLLGEKVARADDKGVFPGYEPDDSPAVALTHALIVLLDYDRLPELLDALLTVAELREPQLAELRNEFRRVSDITDDYDQLSLNDHNRLLDDLVPHLLEMAKRGYLADFLRSYSDQRAHGLQAGLADMIRYRDVLDDQAPGGMEFHLPTDFDLSDSQYANRSNLQKMLHLTWDTNGAEHGTSIAGFDVFTISDMLAFWLDSTADTGNPDEGLAYVPWYVVAAVSEFTGEYPPVEEVDRFMNHDHTILGNPKGREGHELLNYNAESLLALEVSGMLDALRPGSTAMTIRDRDQQRSGTKVFADLLASLHPHYSVNVPNASSACANMRVLEPMLLDILDNTDVLRVAGDFLGSLDGLKTASGLDVVDELALFTRHLLEPDPAILRHDGGDWVFAGDDTTHVSPISRLYLLVDAMRVVDDALEADPEADAALDRTTDLLKERFLKVEETDGIWRFSNRRAWFLALNAVSFFSERAEKHRDAGELSAKLAEIEDDLRDAVGGRVTPRLVDAFQLIADDAELPGELDSITLDLLDSSDPGWVRTLRKAAAWLLQDLLVDRVSVPMAHSIGRQIDPDGYGWKLVPGAGCAASDPPNVLVSSLMKLLLRMRRTQVPERDVFAELLANAGSLISAPDGYPLYDFGEVIGAVHREDPEQTGEKSVDDIASILKEVSDYLTDDDRGLEKLYQQVERRNGF